jgi:hypothetical protein
MSPDEFVTYVSLIGADNELFKPLSDRTATILYKFIVNGYYPGWFLDNVLGYLDTEYKRLEIVASSTERRELPVIKEWIKTNMPSEMYGHDHAVYNWQVRRNFGVSSING